jgi:hypothetical protein
MRGRLGLFALKNAVATCSQSFPAYSKYCTELCGWGFTVTSPVFTAGIETSRATSALAFLHTTSCKSLRIKAGLSRGAVFWELVEEPSSSLTHSSPRVLQCPWAFNFPHWCPSMHIVELCVFALLFCPGSVLCIPFSIP